MKKTVTLLLCAGFLFFGLTAKTVEAQDQWSIGYYLPWQNGGPGIPVSAIQWTGLTHVIDFAASVNADGSLSLWTTPTNNTNAALVTAAHANQVKVLLGLMSSDFNEAVENHLSTTVTNIVDIINTYGYDGVDIDWEPRYGFAADATSAANMKILAAALRTALGKNKLLTVFAIVVDAAYWGTAYAPFDRVNVGTYYFGGWLTAGFNSPLYDPAAFHISLDKYKTEFTVAGVPAAKLGLGLAFYGLQYTGGVLDSDHSQGISGPWQAWQTGQDPTRTVIDYHSILSLITQQNYHWDASSVVPYLGHLGATPPDYWYITYDDPQSIQAKVQYIIAQGLGGWVIWHLGYDYLSGNPHPHPLLDAVQAGSAPAVLSAPALSSGTVGTVYSASLSATGAVPLQWSLSSGSLPRGLSLSSVGAISGTPTTAGTFTFIVTVKNFAGSVSQSFTITITAKTITAFDFNGLTLAVVGSVNKRGKTVTLTVPYGTSLTNLVPTITHTGASVSPASGTTHTFVDGVSTNYTVTAADASTQIYAVTVNVAVATPTPVSSGGNGPIVGSLGGYRLIKLRPKLPQDKN